MAANFYMTYELNLGATIVMNEEFFAKIFMNPLFHFSPFFLGILLSLVYWNFKEERITGNMGVNSIYGRSVEMVRNNRLPRYTGYLLSLALIIGTVYW